MRALAVVHLELEGAERVAHEDQHRVGLAHAAAEGRGRGGGAGLPVDHDPHRGGGPRAAEEADVAGDGGVAPLERHRRVVDDPRVAVDLGARAGRERPGGAGEVVAGHLVHHRRVGRVAGVDVQAQLEPHAAQVGRADRRAGVASADARRPLATQVEGLARAGHRRPDRPMVSAIRSKADIDNAANLDLSGSGQLVGFRFRVGDSGSAGLLQGFGVVLNREGNTVNLVSSGGAGGVNGRTGLTHVADGNLQSVDNLVAVQFRRLVWFVSVIRVNTVVHRFNVGIVDTGSLKGGGNPGRGIGGLFLGVRDGRGFKLDAYIQADYIRRKNNHAGTLDGYTAITAR